MLSVASIPALAPLSRRILIMEWKSSRTAMSRGENPSLLSVFM